VTPRLSSAAMAGVVCSLTIPGRSPPATNSTTFRGRGGSGALAALAGAVAPINGGAKNKAAISPRMGNLGPG
jgi:hypothetical protein